VSFDHPDLNDPLDVRRKIDRKWQRYSAAAMRARLANDRKADGGRCPLCNAPAPIAPIASSYRDAGPIPSSVAVHAMRSRLDHDRTHGELTP